MMGVDQPLAHQRGFAETGRRGDERQRRLFVQARARDKVRARGWKVKFGGEK